jgi:hypothetical protein
MLRKLSKKHLAALAFVGALAITGVSVAYFTGGSGTITGSGTVGTSTPWNIAPGGTPTFSGSLTAIYPGAGTEFFPFTVTNKGNGQQSLTNIVPAVSKDANGYIISNGVAVTGCLASWFTATTDPANAALPDLAPNATYSGTIDLTMQDPVTPTNQDACKGVTPAVTITAS